MRNAQNHLSACGGARTCGQVCTGCPGVSEARTSHFCLVHITAFSGTDICPSLTHRTDTRTDGRIDRATGAVFGRDPTRCQAAWSSTRGSDGSGGPEVRTQPRGCAARSSWSPGSRSGLGAGPERHRSAAQTHLAASSGGRMTEPRLCGGLTWLPGSSQNLPAH